MGLRDLEFKVSYSSDADDLARSFYNPCLREAATYDRITGYFSSSIYILSWTALRSFVAKGGTVRLLCSPHLSDQDADGLELGYRARSDQELAEQLVRELESLLNDPELRSHATLLACLVASGHLDIRLATVTDGAAAVSKRMFHDKVGIFADSDGALVGFGGSMNETLNGLLHNVESVSVWPSWDSGRDAQRVTEASRRFEDLWNGRGRGVRIHQMPEAAQEIIRRVAAGTDLESAFEDCDELPGGAGSQPRYNVGLRRHQEEAITKWSENGNRGLLAHATGSGKTRTGLACMGQALDSGLTPIVAVPSSLLLEQWEAEVRTHLGLRAVLCGGGHSTWQRDRLVRAAIDSDSRQVIIAINNSASTAAFLAQVRGRGARVCFVADEAHRLGSSGFASILDHLDAAQRLGLSATPERAGDDTGTQRLLGYFGGVVHRYTLKNALDDNYLTPYDYEISFVSLTEPEQDDWDELTTKVKRTYGRMQGSDDVGSLAQQVRNLLIRRARIVKNAASKPAHAAQVLAERFEPGQRWLVYCDNIEQVHATIDHLGEVGVSALPYYRGMADDPGQVLALFRHAGGVVVSIRCLDEGVDIPSADHALLMASSQNPREHIQRRGRVLRPAHGKLVAKLHDVVTLPGTVDLEDQTWKVAAAELSRAAEFDAWAIVPGRARRQLERKWVALGLPLELLDEAVDGGVEEEEET